MAEQILVDKDRYEALEALFTLLQYESEVYPEDCIFNHLRLRAIGHAMFELEKNSTLGPARNLIQQYEHLTGEEYILRSALAEIANMGGEAAIRARKALDELFKGR